jgi:hypothetical protein
MKKRTPNTPRMTAHVAELVIKSLLAGETVEEEALEDAGQVLGEALVDELVHELTAAA